MIRNFKIGDTELCIGNYTPRKNTFEKGLKYILLKRVYDGNNADTFSCHDTGFRGSTIRECKEWAYANKARWM